MKIYICGIGEAYTYERIVRRQTRCFVCLYNTFYNLTVQSVKYNNSEGNNIFVPNCTDAEIIEGICAAEKNGTFNRCTPVYYLDLDNHTDKVYGGIVERKWQVIRFQKKLYAMRFSKHTHAMQDQTIIGNDYDDEATLNQIREVLFSCGLLPDVEFCAIVMTELQLLYRS